ncbi:hypothetical protein LPJ57_008738 [Coemansia sp. RSA 486]|nr:hypothetical protein LPJ57_008738 [Coemansia sp. RSA 486]
MRLPFALSLLALLACLSVVFAWDKLDHEIFELHDDVKKNEATTDWYELLSLGPKATVDEINKAYRQLSRKYHPDKLQRLSSDVSQTQKKRFQRLSLVVNILRDPESRKKYNFFRKNGVPTWRGTGYLYNRWRPGFTAVVVGLLMFAASMQYLFQYLSYWRAQQRIQDIEAEAKRNGGQFKLKKKNMTKNRSGNNSDDQQQQMQQQQDNPALLNTEGVINPYAVQPPSVKRLFVAKLPMALLAAVGLYKQTPVEELLNEQDREEDEALRQAVDSAVQSADDSTRDTFAAQPSQPLVDPEVKAKKAAKKAAKSEARRRRANLV